MGVISTSGGEERARVGVDGRFEAQCVDVELPRGGDVADLQVYVANLAGAVGAGSNRCFIQVPAQVLVRVQEDGIHLDLTVVVLPVFAVAVHVQFDPVTFRVGEIEGFADQVVTGAHEPAAGVLGGSIHRGGHTLSVLAHERGV